MLSIGNFYWIAYVQPSIIVWCNATIEGLNGLCGPCAALDDIQARASYSAPLFGTQRTIDVPVRLTAI